MRPRQTFISGACGFLAPRTKGLSRAGIFGTIGCMKKLSVLSLALFGAVCGFCGPVGNRLPEDILARYSRNPVSDVLSVSGRRFFSKADCALYFACAFRDILKTDFKAGKVEFSDSFPKEKGKLKNGVEAMVPVVAFCVGGKVDGLGDVMVSVRAESPSRSRVSVAVRGAGEEEARAFAEKIMSLAMEPDADAQRRYWNLFLGKAGSWSEYRAFEREARGFSTFNVKPGSDDFRETLLRILEGMHVKAHITAVDSGDMVFYFSSPVAVGAPGAVAASPDGENIHGRFFLPDLSGERIQFFPSAMSLEKSDAKLVAMFDHGLNVYIPKKDARRFMKAAEECGYSKIK